MIQSDTSQEEVTVIQQSTNPVEPQAKGEAPQKVYEKKKTIFRFNQIIWYMLGFVEILLTFRVVLKMLGANAGVGFTSIIYSVTTPLVAPFVGILRMSTVGNSTFEWSTIIAGVVYTCIAWGFVYLLNLIYPITPSDVATQ